MFVAIENCGKSFSVLFLSICSFAFQSRKVHPHSELHLRTIKHRNLDQLQAAIFQTFQQLAVIQVLQVIHRLQVFPHRNLHSLRLQLQQPLSHTLAVTLAMQQVDILSVIRVIQLVALPEHHSHCQAHQVSQVQNISDSLLLH